MFENHIGITTNDIRIQASGLNDVQRSDLMELTKLPVEERTQLLMFAAGLIAGSELSMKTSQKER